MIAFVFSILVVGALARARPDVSELGYQYKTPFTSYEAPSGSIGSLDQRKYYHVDDRTFHAPPTQFQTPVFEHSAFNKGTFGTTIRPFIGGGAQTSGFNLGSSGPFVTTTIRPFIGEHVQTFGSNLESSGLGSNLNLNSRLNIGGGAQISTDGFQSSGHDFHHQKSELSRHLYFFAAPEEHEVIKPRINIISGPAKKNVKIIFIKAPSTAVSGPITIPAPPQNEEKTVVYVLVKKQDEQAQINVEASQPAPPSKPEVFFIKYKSQQEAQDAISKVQSGVIPQGLLSNVNSVEGDQAFIGTISRDNLISQNLGGLSPAAQYQHTSGLDLRFQGEGASSAVSSSGSSQEVGQGIYNLQTGGGSANLIADGQGIGSSISRGSVGGYDGFQSTTTAIPFGGYDSFQSTTTGIPVGVYDGFQSTTTAIPDLGGNFLVSSSVPPSVHTVYGPPHTS